MMKPKFTQAALAAAIFGGSALLSLVGCTKPAENTVIDTQTLSFTRVNTSANYRLIGSAKDYESQADLTFDCKADLLMPTAVFGHDVAALQDAILKQAFDTVGTDHNALIKDVFHSKVAELGYALADTVVADSGYDGLYNVDGSVEALTTNVLSYAVTVSYYTPRAAHGMYSTFYVNYDVENGKVFNINDIFTAEGLEKLPDMLKTAAKDLSGFIGPTQIEGIPQDGNFCISANGDIVFVYQPYEVASYAQGEISIPVAPYVLSSYLTTYGNKLLMNVD